MTTEIIEAEARRIQDDGAGERSLAIMETVALPVSVEVALQQWQDYQRLTRELLDDSDYQKIGNKKFKKKSAWRKYARAFNITDRVTYEHVERDEGGHPIWARVRVEARATNGRTAEADHECHIGERCCPSKDGLACRQRTWDSHTCCEQGCTMRHHWSHPGDLPATALTRAKNRAISDLIGAGEVSAEEMVGQRAIESDKPTATPRPAQRPVQKAPDMRAPFCPKHDQECNFVPAGTSKATGKAYSSFYSCPDKGCTAGYKGRPWTIFTPDWQDQLSREANESAPREPVDYDAVPSE